MMGIVVVQMGKEARRLVFDLLWTRTYGVSGCCGVIYGQEPVDGNDHDVDDGRMGGTGWLAFYSLQRLGVCIIPYEILFDFV